MTEKLPISELTPEAFREIKRRFLDDEVLSNEALEEIKRLFATRDPGSYTIKCYEYHAHSPRCVEYHNPTTAIVARLLAEIRAYSVRMGGIERLVIRDSPMPPPL